jgi:asparagine synthetase B (glutamine-hydrolysing)
VLSRCETVDELVKFIEALNGFYAIVLEIEGEIVLGADQIRSTPLFYQSNSSEIVVTDDDRTLIDDTRNPTVVGEYALTGYVTGSDTLLTDVEQVEAGQIVSVDTETGAIETYQHTDYLPGSSMSSSTLQELLDRYDDVVEAACSRLIDYADGRPIVVALARASTPEPSRRCSHALAMRTRLAWCTDTGLRTKSPTLNRWQTLSESTRWS